MQWNYKLICFCSAWYTIIANVRVAHSASFVEQSFVSMFDNRIVMCPIYIAEVINIKKKNNSIILWWLGFIELLFFFFFCLWNCLVGYLTCDSSTELMMNISKWHCPSQELTMIGKCNPISSCFVMSARFHKLLFKMQLHCPLILRWAGHGRHITRLLLLLEQQSSLRIILFEVEGMVEGMRKIMKSNDDGNYNQEKKTFVSLR